MTRLAASATKKKPTSSRGAPLKTKTHQHGSEFAKKLIDGLNETLAIIDAGEMHTLKQTTIQVPVETLRPADIRAIREALGLSQPLFAEFIGASVSTIRSWEQGSKSPAPLARTILIAMRDDRDYWQLRLNKVISKKSHEL